MSVFSLHLPIVKSAMPTNLTGWDILIGKAKQVGFNHRMRPTTIVPIWAAESE
jgi:hypothetical protein